MRLSRPPLRLAAPTAFPFLAGKKANSTERDCFEANFNSARKPVMATLLALNGTVVPPARDYMAHSRRQGCAAHPSLGLHHDRARLARGRASKEARRKSAWPIQERRRIRFVLRRRTTAPTARSALVVFCLRTRATQGGSVDPTQISVNRKWPRPQFKQCSRKKFVQRL